MIYLVRSCVTINKSGKVQALCGGWCCYKLNFKEFPHGNWHSKPCDYLEEGVCSCYADRPKACEESPFFDGGPHLYPAHKFIVPWCIERRGVLDLYGLKYTILESGAACIEQYSKQGLGDFERWSERRFFKNRTLFYE